MHVDAEADLRAAHDGDLHRLTGFALTGFMFGRGIPHRIVPRDHWERAEGVAELRCQCGALHVVRLGASPQSCTCRRWFFFDGTDVWALLSPAA